MIIITDHFTDFSLIIYMRLFIIAKLGQGFQKVEKLEIYFIHNFYYEQYWSLIKVFIFNISLAHIIAICLVSMAGVDQDNNWMHYKDICIAPWF